MNPRLFLSLALALNLAGSEAAPQAPEYLTVIPAGPRLVGIDGRAWLLDNPQAFVAALNAHPVDLPIDFNHSTELKAPKGEESPAAAWMKQGQYRLATNGAIEARVEWSERGRSAVTGREYRYLSPAFTFERSSQRVLMLSSAGLVPKPNLTELPALNAAGADLFPTMKPEQFVALCAVLGLAADTSADALHAAVVKLKSEHATALNAAQHPDPARFILKSDYDLAINRATAAETKLATQAEAALNAERTALLDQAVREGKVAPASREALTALACNADGLGKLKDYLSKLSPVIGDQSAPGGAPVDATALNSAAVQLAGVFGNSAEDLKKYGA